MRNWIFVPFYLGTLTAGIAGWTHGDALMAAAGFAMFLAVFVIHMLSAPE